MSWLTGWNGNKPTDDNSGARPRRNLPFINYFEPPLEEEIEEEDFNFEDAEGELDFNPLVSPRRPPQSPSASPRALLHPDPLPTEDVLLEVEQKLSDLPTYEPVVEDEGVVFGGPQVTGNLADPPAAILPDDAQGQGQGHGQPAAPPQVNYDTQNTQDGDRAADLARSIKIEFSPSDILFWFTLLEDEMLMASVGSQWLKKTVLQRNLPTRQKEDVKGFLTIQQVQAGPHIYLDIKSELIRIYAQKPCDSYRKALTRTMVGLPSQLGYQIVDDICKRPVKLTGCCCPAAVQCLWSTQLPVTIQGHISNMEFDATTYKSVFEAADKVFLSS